MKVGIFGGVFDPVHNGHLNSAEEVRVGLGFDKIIFVVSYDPPHKEGTVFLNARERYDLVLLAISGNENFEVSDIEIKREKKSYTKETIDYFESLYGQADTSFIIGADALKHIGSWHKADEILDTKPLVVMTREGSSLDQIASHFDIGNDFSKVELDSFSLALAKSDKIKAKIPRRENSSVRVLNVSRLDISSSMIRSKISRQESLLYLLPLPASNYIKEKFFKTV